MIEFINHRLQEIELINQQTDQVEISLKRLDLEQSPLKEQCYEKKDLLKHDAFAYPGIFYFSFLPRSKERTRGSCVRYSLPKRAVLSQHSYSIGCT